MLNGSHAQPHNRQSKSCNGAAVVQLHARLANLKCKQAYLSVRTMKVSRASNCSSSCTLCSSHHAAASRFPSALPAQHHMLDDKLTDELMQTL